jgi:hypothetical protein
MATHQDLALNRLMTFSMIIAMTQATNATQAAKVTAPQLLRPAHGKTSQLSSRTMATHQDLALNHLMTYSMRIAMTQATKATQAAKAM